ncbi:hypothetical protein JJB09_12115 [Rhizobium sp. KVB221]|uniref:Uncharacterized protein n=1 Tax=Rhizobium setariae TaxID=2801340 RepID=A0A936YQN9_9HYPH|nr:hypothetical protein [Rhizobium setariae]MBL0372776.1 hypothetical protein [Rhizobium setariae]
MRQPTSDADRKKATPKARDNSQNDERLVEILKAGAILAPGATVASNRADSSALSQAYAIVLLMGLMTAAYVHGLVTGQRG